MRRQRLVGALVLLALGVVFWPIIFVESPQRELPALPPSAERPVIDTTPFPAPERPAQLLAMTDTPPPSLTPELAPAETLDALPEKAPTAAITAPQTRDKAPAVNPVTAKGNAQLWVLQVASVSSKARATEVVDLLKAKNYRAYFQVTKRSNGTFYRIQIGPKAERAAIERIKPAVDRLLAVDALVEEYKQPHE
jgi:DedD protein